MSGQVQRANAGPRACACRAREEAAQYKEFYGSPIPGKVMAERLAGFVHAYTMYWSVRPFGSAVLIAGKDADGPFLWMVRGPLLSAVRCRWIVAARKQLQMKSLRVAHVNCPGSLHCCDCVRASKTDGWLQRRWSPRA